MAKRKPKKQNSLPADSERSFAGRLIDANLEAAMGGYVDDELADHIDWTGNSDPSTGEMSG